MAIKLIPMEPVKKDKTFWLEYGGFRKDHTGYYSSKLFECKAKTLKGAKCVATRILTRKVEEDGIINPNIGTFFRILESDPVINAGNTFPFYALVAYKAMDGISKDIRWIDIEEE